MYFICNISIFDSTRVLVLSIGTDGVMLRVYATRKSRCNTTPACIGLTCGDN